MKALLLSLATLFLTFTTHAGGLCSDPFHQTEVCERMRYLKASLNVLDGQRELNQVNYPYLAAIGATMKNDVVGIMNVIDMTEADHLKALKDLKNNVTELEALANASDIKAAGKSVGLKASCTTCHAGEKPPSGVKWGDVFYYNWTQVVQDCDNNGGNPYICRNMNGLLTTYSHILTQMTTQIEDFEVLKQNGLEILRIFGEMKNVRAFHMKPELVEDAVNSAQELVKLADAKDSEAYTKAVLMANACSSCHTDFGKRGIVGGGNPNFFNIWK